jgi:Haemolysin XhlA
LQEKDNIGLFISVKEMYESIQTLGDEFRSTSQQILTRLSVMESKLAGVGQTEERAREALKKADEAYNIAQKVENQQVWLWRVIIGALVTGAVMALFSFAQKSI